MGVGGTTRGPTALAQTDSKDRPGAGAPKAAHEIYDALLGQDAAIIDRGQGSGGRALEDVVGAAVSRTGVAPPRCSFGGPLSRRRVGWRCEHAITILPSVSASRYGATDGTTMLPSVQQLCGVRQSAAGGTQRHRPACLRAQGVHAGAAQRASKAAEAAMPALATLIAVRRCRRRLGARAAAAARNDATKCAPSRRCWVRRQKRFISGRRPVKRRSNSSPTVAN